MNGRPTNSGRESDVSFPLDLEFIPEWQTELPQMVGEAGKEAVILTRLQLSSLGSESPPEFPPTQKRGKERGVQRRNPVFGWPTERSSFVTLSDLQEIKNQELSECEPSPASSLYNSQSKTWGSLTFEP